MSVAAIVLAAGRGTRFGATPKMLALFEGSALVRHAAQAALGAGASPVLVVVGHEAEAVAAALAGLPVEIVRNPAFADGMSTSLRAGFASLPPEAEAVAILLGDMPRVGASLVRQLIAAWRGAGCPAALVPTRRGVRGNPVVLSVRLASEVASLSGDVGAGPLLGDRSDVLALEIGDDAVSLDVDTPAALERLGADQASTTSFRIAR